MNRGYIVPVILIVLLLILAGVFVFTDQIVESPVVDEKTPQAIQVIPTTTPSEPDTSDTDADSDEDVSTSSDSDIDVQATTSLELELEE